METFRVYVTFESGVQHLDTDWTDDMDNVKGAIARLTLGPSRTFNKAVIVVDSLDCTVFKWVEGEVLWPKQEAVAND
tara:strand:+ start:8667 stop:8897 length:231 start_codon:yes stop_codon:yes gene_type:complete